MRRVLFLFSVLLLTACAAAPQLASPPDVRPNPALDQIAWLQLGDGGAGEIRAVAEGANCPRFTQSNGIEIALQLRAPANDAFARVCSAPLPAGAKVEGLPAIKARPERILVLGDTGCRVLNLAVQSCNSPKDWPFPALAASAARLKPDLVIDLGDYQYRETPCPPGNDGCAGTPYGDNWPAWKADFFAPAAPLLAAAPWLFVRGNHEDCHRAWRGFMRLLGPLPHSPDCAAHLAPYRVPLGGLTLLVMDNADASDATVDASKVPLYQAELADAVSPGAVPVWLAMHRPIWAVVTGPLNVPVGGNAQIIAAAEKTMITKPVALMLSGHIHSFQAINYAGGQPPPQIVAGNGGDTLHVIPANLKGAIFQGHSGVAVQDGLSVGGFGFLLLTRGQGKWTIDLYDSAGVAEGQCLFDEAAGRVDCPRLPAGR